MRNAQTCFAIVCIALLLKSPLPAQTEKTDSTTFKSSSELVLIPTVVNDKSGAFISGLKKEDFVLKQDGKAHSIAVFEEVKTDSAQVQRSEGEHGSFSNFEPGSAERHRLSIIVLDFVNTSFADQANAKNALLKFLSDVANSGEPMCLLTLTRNGLTLLHDFTDHPKLLAEGIHKVESNAPSLIHEPETDAGHPPPNDALGAALTRMIREQLQSEAQLSSAERKVTALVTVQALEQIAKAFRGFPGRKALVWASSGFPFSLSPPSALMCEPACPVSQRGEVQSSYDNLWRMMNDAQIAIYSVDLRTATSGGPAANEGTFTHPYDMGDPQFDTAAQAKWESYDTGSTLQLFAERTGGKSFLGGNNLVQSFRQAIQDDSSYYMLGYYVGRSSTKPGWHLITVTTDRKGAHPRYRSGFLLSRDVSAPVARQDVELALHSPLDFVGVPVSITWTGKEPGKTPGKTKVEFDLVMPPHFASVDESDQNHMVVDIAAVARTPNGQVVTELSQRIDAHLKSDGMEQIQRNGMTYRNGLQLGPGEYTVRFVVRDSLGNRMGSVSAPIRVAP